MKTLQKNIRQLLITLIVTMGAFIACVALLRGITFRNMSSAQMDAVSGFIELAFCLTAAAILGRLPVLKPRLEGFGKGMLAALVPLFFCLRAIPGLMNNLKNYGTFMTISVFDFIMIVLHYILVGICEELLFRGLMQNSLHDFFGEDTQKKVRFAIFLQALFFGLIHFTNIFTSQQGLPSSLVQVIAAFGMGALFGAIYYRAQKNIWVTIFIHALFDLSGSVKELIGTTSVEGLRSYVTEQPSFAALTASIIQIAVFSLILCGIALFLTRKKVLTRTS